MTAYTGDNWSRLVDAWARRAEVELQAEDPFAAFFFAYMALVAASARGLTQERDDGRLIKEYLETRGERLPQLVDLAREHLDYFGQRLSASGNAPVLEFMGATKATEDRDYPIVRRLKHLDGAAPSDVTEAIAVLLIRIRNNLFHGNKDYDSESDAEVLLHAVHVILAALVLFEGLEPVSG